MRECLPCIPQVLFVLGLQLKPDDVLKVSAPSAFFWRFEASEFIPRPAFRVDDALPVQAVDADGSSRVLHLRLTDSLQPGPTYGFEARVQTPSTPPPVYYWMLETYGPGTDAGALGQRYETGSLQAYRLELLTEASVAAFTSMRAASGPVTVAFRTDQAVPVGGTLLIRSPSDFVFQEPCSASALQLGQAISAQAIEASLLRCKVVTAREVQLVLLESNDAPGLNAGELYSVTIHSVLNPMEQGFEVLPSNIWELQTRDGELKALDGPTFVTGFRVGEELPFGALASGPASVGMNMA
ncbi:unnamed protein product [Symbiodinium sp. CCMP2592]|nr:unnamed protein product [Symbiodinium sp. CCMP2592]